MKKEFYIVIKGQQKSYFCLTDTEELTRPGLDVEVGVKRSKTEESERE